MSQIVRFGLVFVALVLAAILLAEGRLGGAGRVEQEGGPEATGSAIVPPGPTPDALSAGGGFGGASATQTPGTATQTAVVPATPIAVPIGKMPVQATPNQTPPVGDTDSEGN